MFENEKFLMNIIKTTGNFNIFYKKTLIKNKTKTEKNFSHLISYKDHLILQLKKFNNSYQYFFEKKNFKIIKKLNFDSSYISYSTLFFNLEYSILQSNRDYFLIEGKFL
jgi:hypothetical protein